MPDKAAHNIQRRVKKVIVNLVILGWLGGTLWLLWFYLVAPGIELHKTSDPVTPFMQTSITNVKEFVGDIGDRITGAIGGITTSIQSSTSTDVDDYAAKFNAYRVSNGLPALVFTPALNRIATLRLPEVQVEFSHHSVGGYNANLGENVVGDGGFLPNDYALSLWKSSPGHNANMLNRDYRRTGYASKDGYAVQVFAW
jgi:uncharacterized protein YkwD